MNINFPLGKTIAISRLPALLRLSVIVAGVFLLSGCEAPLVLDGVESSKARTTLRFDQFQSAAHANGTVVVVGAKGAVLVSDNSGVDWKRFSLEGEPSLITVSACGTRGFAALDFNRRVWISDGRATSWKSHALPTQETPLTLACSPAGDIWVAGSFSSFWSSKDQGKSWSETSLNDDLMFTSVQFLNEQLAYATGEFGTVAVTRDGGQQWEMLEPLPNELYPQAALFVSENEGWVAGLNGVILHTTDGAQSWSRLETPTETPIYGMAVAGQSVFAVGNHGTVLFSEDGVHWNNSPVTTYALTYLRGLAAVSPTELVVAGGNGLLTRINPKATQTAQLQPAGGAQ